MFCWSWLKHQKGHRHDRACLYLILHDARADPAFVIRGGPNSEHFLSNLRKLIKGGKFFLTTESLIVKRNWVYTNQFIKTCFLLKKTFTWHFFGWFLFKNKARCGFGNLEKGEGELIWLDMVYFMIMLALSTPLYSTFKLKYRKNVKRTIFLIETSVKARK